jgi:putative SOS response-associated peptidase YedK
MCGAYGYTVKNEKELYDRFEVINALENFKPRYITHIGTMNPVIYMTADGVQIKNMYWTFIPSWAREKRLKFSTFNARSDRVMESTVYKSAVPSQRCIIPATHFYEPDKVHFHKPPYPWYYFGLKTKEIFGFAGLYNVWTDPKTGEKLYTYTIMTTDPNEEVGEYHPREPALLRDRQVEKDWINPDITEPEQALAMLEPYPTGNLEWWHAPDAAKNPRIDSPDLIKPVEETEQKSFL